MTPFEGAVRGSLEGSRDGRVYVYNHDELGDRATPLCGTQLRMETAKGANSCRGPSPSGERGQQAAPRAAWRFAANSSASSHDARCAISRRYFMMSPCRLSVSVPTSRSSSLYSATKALASHAPDTTSGSPTGRPANWMRWPYQSDQK